MEKEKPQVESDPWNPDLDWYFNEYESLIGFKSIGTSGVGDNELRPPTDEEKAERKERQRNGFLLSVPEQPKAQLRSVTPAEADRAAFQVMARGILARGRRIWRKLTRLPYSVQECLRASYAGRPVDRGNLRWAHRMFTGETSERFTFETPAIRVDPEPPQLAPWKNKTPCGLRYEFREVHHE